MAEEIDDGKLDALWVVRRLEVLEQQGLLQTAMHTTKKGREHLEPRVVSDEDVRAYLVALNVPEELLDPFVLMINSEEEVNEWLRKRAELN